MSATAGTSGGGTSGGRVLTESDRDMSRLLTILYRLLEIPRHEVVSHPIYQALRKAALVRWNGDFIHLTADLIDQLVYDDARGIEVKLEMSYKLQLRALLAYYHEVSHKKGGSANISGRTLDDDKEFRNSGYDPTRPIVLWWNVSAKNEGLSNWNKSIKPNARDFKPFRDGTLWVEYKEIFMITLEAQNLTHLVDPKYYVSDGELDKAQKQFMYKVMKDNFLHHEAKAIVKKFSKGKDTREIWTQVCKFYDDSITTSIEADGIMGYLADVKLHTANWPRPQGEFVTHYRSQVRKPFLGCVFVLWIVAGWRLGRSPLVGSQQQSPALIVGPICRSGTNQGLGVAVAKVLM